MKNVEPGTSAESTGPESLVDVIAGLRLEGERLPESDEQRVSCFNITRGTTFQRNQSGKHYLFINRQR
ncbi:hypothetical protein AC249_AIPGENE29252 [Exaiptasia diaphana]|nr:hypothetical protein AC249_AIPGENE29252 [Exaiptasia diaphana]